MKIFSHMHPLPEDQEVIARTGLALYLTSAPSTFPYSSEKSISKGPNRQGPCAECPLPATSLLHIIRVSDDDALLPLHTVR